MTLVVVIIYQCFTVQNNANNIHSFHTSKFRAPGGQNTAAVCQLANVEMCKNILQLSHNILLLSLSWSSFNGNNVHILLKQELNKNKKYNLLFSSNGGTAPS